MQSSRLIGAIALVEAVATMLFAVNPLFCQPPAPATLRQSQSEEINYLTFTLAHRTLTPQTVTVKQGFYTLRLRNGMLAGAANFQLLAVNGNKTQLVKLDANKGKGSLDYRLTPGKYELTIVELPAIKSIITVE